MDTLLRDIAFGAIASAAFVVLVAMFRLWRHTARIRARSARAVAGEREAVALLRASGYAIIKSQIAIEYPIEVDGETYAFGLRADFLVSKDGARYVAEVKTGALAPRIDTAATRRQLLEYEVAFRVDGVLLVDADARCVHTVAFPTLSGRRYFKL